MPTMSRDVRQSVNAAEWAVRVDLAACYRLAAHFRLTDLIYTHISSRVPHEDSHFLINAYGLLFSEIKASTLVKVKLDGTIVDDPTGLGINAAGFVIHGAVHGARHDVGCVMHTHTTAGLAVAAQRQGLLPLTQHAMRFTDSIGYHDYEGIALDVDEQARLVRDLGTHNALILRNHGLLGLRSDGARRVRPHDASRAGMPGAGGGARGRRAGRDAVAEVARKVAAQFARPGRQAPANAWAALLRMLDRKDSSYRE
jgi:ribulose-5-phosphate 4-epimerase/fuculose-1-phosphate aldolase